MTEKSNIPSEFSEAEKAILLHIYSHPGHDNGTYQLMKVLRPEAANEQEPQREAYQVTQYAVETLVSHRLVEGERAVAYGGDVYYSNLKLTRKGEAEAINQKRK